MGVGGWTGTEIWLSTPLLRSRPTVFGGPCHFGSMVILANDIAEHDHQPLSKVKEYVKGELNGEGI